MSVKLTTHPNGQVLIVDISGKLTLAEGTTPLPTTIRDLASGAVELGRLATHLGAVAGLVLVYTLSVSERATPPPASAVVGTDQPDEPGRGLRGVA